LREIGGMIRPSQSIGFIDSHADWPKTAKNRLVPDFVILCRFPLYSDRETGYKSKKRRQEFPAIRRGPVARPGGAQGEGGKGRGKKGRML